MSLDNITRRIKEKISQTPGLRAKIKFDFGEDGMIFIDTTQNPAAVSHEDSGEAETTLSCALDTFERILDGTQDPNIAFMMGKLKVKGSMGLAMKLNAILEE
ncbi:MAG: SCP2 sterol-binding domain-containing protein [Alphaproteobacteria bacterium]|nr:SCP2 sterol-binding domain-containing protein [Alphaproteobacteria bacterium]